MGSSVCSPTDEPVIIVDGILDSGIAQFVKTLQEHGIETFESCEGGPGHAFPVPTVRFSGGHEQGYRAVWVALTFGPLPIDEIRRTWSVIDGALTGPEWEMTFFKKAPRAEGVPALATTSSD